MLFIGAMKGSCDLLSRLHDLGIAVLQEQRQVTIFYLLDKQVIVEFRTDF